MNAVLLPVLLILLLKLANDPELLGRWVNKKSQNILTLSLTLLITVITIGLFVIPLFK